MENDGKCRTNGSITALTQVPAAELLRLVTLMMEFMLKGIDFILNLIDFTLNMIDYWSDAASDQHRALDRNVPFLFDSGGQVNGPCT